MTTNRRPDDPVTLDELEALADPDYEFTDHEDEHE